MAPSGLTLSPMVFASGSSRVSADARLEDYTSPFVDGSYQAVVSSGELGKLLKNNLLARGASCHAGNRPIPQRSPTAIAEQPVYWRENLQSRTVVDLPGAFARVGPFRSEYRL